jgi:hypothetical protein
MPDKESIFKVIKSLSSQGFTLVNLEKYRADGYYAHMVKGDVGIYLEIADPKHVLIDVKERCKKCGSIACECDAEFELAGTIDAEYSTWLAFQNS